MTTPAKTAQTRSHRGRRVGADRHKTRWRSLRSHPPRSSRSIICYRPTDTGGVGYPAYYDQPTRTLWIIDPHGFPLYPPQPVDTVHPSVLYTPQTQPQ